MFTCGVLNLRIQSPDGVTALELGNLLVALERLWIAHAGGDEDAALRVLEIGTGSIWARIAAECRNAPVSTFLNFCTAAAAAASPVWSPYVPGPGIGAYGSPKADAERSFKEGCAAFTNKGGAVEIERAGRGFGEKGPNVDGGLKDADSLYGGGGLYKAPAEDPRAEELAKQRAQYSYGYKPGPGDGEKTD